MSPEPSRPHWTAESTAEAFASLRASGTAERDERVRNPDYLASKFVGLGPRLTSIAKIPLLRRLGPVFSERIVPGAYFYEIARVKHMDCVLQEEVASGVNQLVILGAGYDTRPYRFADILRDVRVFEVDHPVTAALKQRRVKRIFGALPGHVTYVEIDFDADDMADVLTRSGYDSRLKAFFIWSGVTAYLSEGGVDSVLAFVRDHSAPGSAIVFDYAYRAAIAGTLNYHGSREATRRAAELGEPMIFGIEEGTASQFLQDRGLELVSDLGPRELEHRYLVRTDGQLRGRPYGYSSIVHARVPQRRLHA